MFCGADVESDDAHCITSTGRCICQRCWQRETGTTHKPLSKALLWEVENAMGGES